MKTRAKSAIAVAVFVAAGILAINIGEPSLFERAVRSEDIYSCLNRNGCWDYERQGCVWQKSAFSEELEPTEQQQALQICHRPEDAQRLMDASKHLRLW